MRRRFSNQPQLGRLAVAACVLVCQPIAAAQLSETNSADKKSAIVMTGDFGRGDADHLTRFIEDSFLRKNRTLTAIYLDSHGGIIGEGSRIAKIVRRLDVAVVVSDSAVCQSTCFLVLAASTQRIIGMHASLGVHSAAIVPDEVAGKTSEDMPAMASTLELARLYRKYGVPDSVIAGMVTTLPDSLYTLSEHEKDLLRAGASH